MEFVTTKPGIKNHLFFLNILIIFVILFSVLYKDYSFNKNSILVNETLLIVDKILYEIPDTPSSSVSGRERQTHPLFEALDARLSLLSPEMIKGIPPVNMPELANCKLCESRCYLTDLTVQIKKNLAFRQRCLLYHDALLIILLIAFSAVHFWTIIRARREVSDSSNLIYRCMRNIGQAVGVHKDISPPPGEASAARVKKLEAYTSEICREILFERQVREIDIHGNLDRVLWELREIFKEKMPCDRIGLAFLDRKGQLSAETTYMNVRDFQWESLYSSGTDRSSLEDYLGEKESLVINDLPDFALKNDVPPLTRAVIREGYRYCIVLSIRFKGHKVGYFIVLGRNEPFTRQDSSYCRRIIELLKHKLYMEYILQHIVSHTSSAFVKLLHERDNETALHIQRMALYSSIIACKYSERHSEVPVRLIREIRWFSPLHDIGKIGIPDHILMKPGSLSDDERRRIQEHVLIGESVIREISDHLSEYLSLSLMETGVDIIASHHEKYDGSGYPRGLAGDDIPLAGRIVALADVFDALTSKRAYKEAYSVTEALQIMEREMGGHFDPEVYACFLESLDEIEKVYEVHKEV